MKQLFSGYVLTEHKEVMVRVYILVSAIIGVAAGLWVESLALTLCGGFLAGVFWSPVLPVWQNVATEFDRSFFERFTKGPQSHLHGVYMAIPALTVILALTLAGDKLFGY